MNKSSQWGVSNKLFVNTRASEIEEEAFASEGFRHMKDIKEVVR